MPLLPSAVRELETWISTAPYVEDGAVTFLEGLVARLRERGLGLWRCNVSLRTMHPEVLWRTLLWTDTDGLIVRDRAHATFLEPFYLRSPVAVLHGGAPHVRVRLGREPARFPICEDLEKLGGTDYYAQALRFASGATGHVAWATRDPSGFTDDCIASLDALNRSLAQRIELESAYDATRTLLEVYLGPNAARRVRAGAFRRGTGELIDAAIWFCDQRGFTALSDRMPPQDVVQMLDAYFERVAGAIVPRGGEILKFIGDAILAIFPVSDDPRAACGSALAAAEDALVAIETLNGDRRARAQEPLAIGVALHLGQVMYGNIGARERLDFTVISSAVNEACRLEALCKPLGTPLVLSDAFVRAARADGIVDLGEHALKGVKAPARVHTLARYRRDTRLE